MRSHTINKAMVRQSDRKKELQCRLQLLEIRNGSDNAFAKMGTN